jgi:hypothetical protein
LTDDIRLDLLISPDIDLFDNGGLLFLGSGGTPQNEEKAKKQNEADPQGLLHLLATFSKRWKWTLGIKTVLYEHRETYNI